MPKMKIGPGMSTVNRFIQRPEKSKKREKDAEETGKVREEGKGEEQEGEEES